MDQQVKAEWVAALRSGEYKQARERLCAIDGSMCCLGVLVDTCVDGEWVHEWGGWTFQGRSGKIPEPVRHRLRLTASQESDLIGLNDRKYWSFGRIANWIEKNL